MRIERGQDGEPLLIVEASDRVGPAVARHMATLVETSGGEVGAIAKLRQVAARMEAWRAAVPVAVEPPASDPDPEPTPIAEPVPTEPEPEDEPEPVELPAAARAGRRSRR